MKVLFCNRDPSLWDGGDTNKIWHYGYELDKLGVECGYAHNIYDQDYSDWDLFHIFHLGHEFSYKFHLEAVRTGKPTVISPVYFPGQDNPECYRKEMIEYSSAMLYLSEGEQKAVEKVFENPRNFIVPNGIDPIFGKQGPKYRHPNRPDEEYVLCVGRLDKRKNQHRLAQACMELDIPLLLIGDPNPNVVTRHCQSIANKWEGLWWEGPQPHDKLAEAYRGAKVLACPSTHEIWPNVVAEGGLAKCNLVISDRSLSFTDLNGVWTCGTDIESIKESVEDAYKTDRREHLQTYFSQFTWGKTAKQLKEVYEDVLKT